MLDPSKITKLLIATHYSQNYRHSGHIYMRYYITVAKSYGDAIHCNGDITYIGHKLWHQRYIALAMSYITIGLHYSHIVSKNNHAPLLRQVPNGQSGVCVVLSLHRFLIKRWYTSLYIYIFFSFMGHFFSPFNDLLLVHITTIFLFYK